MKLKRNLFKTLIPCMIVLGSMGSMANTGSNSRAKELGNKYIHLDPSKKISPKLLREAVDFYEDNANLIPKRDVITIIDYAMKSTDKRMFILNMTTGNVDSYLVSHGKGSDPNHDGYADKFSNVEGSLMSSLGFGVTAETYNGEHGLSLRLDGLSESNNQDRKRDIVLHSAKYVSPIHSPLGRSHGCPAVEIRFHKKIIDTIKEGRLIYRGFDPESRKKGLERDLKLETAVQRLQNGRVSSPSS